MYALHAQTGPWLTILIILVSNIHSVICRILKVLVHSNNVHCRQTHTVHACHALDAGQNVDSQKSLLYSCTSIPINCNMGTIFPTHSVADVEVFFKAGPIVANYNCCEVVPDLMKWQRYVDIIVYYAKIIYKEM